MQTKWVCPSGTQRFCKNDSDWSRVTIFLNVTRFESESPKILTRVELLTWVTLSLQTTKEVSCSYIAQNADGEQIVGWRVWWPRPTFSPLSTDSKCNSQSWYIALQVYFEHLKLADFSEEFYYLSQILAEYLWQGFYQDLAVFRDTI